MPSHNTFSSFPLNKDSVNLLLKYELVLTKEGEIVFIVFPLSIEDHQPREEITSLFWLKLDILFLDHDSWIAVSYLCEVSK